MFDDLGKYNKLIPIGGILLVFLSSIEINVVFSHFGIDIGYYINADELPINLIRQFVHYLGTSAFYFSLFYLAYNINYLVEKLKWILKKYVPQIYPFNFDNSKKWFKWVKWLISGILTVFLPGFLLLTSFVNVADTSLTSEVRYQVAIRYFLFFIVVFVALLSWFNIKRKRLVIVFFLLTLLLKTASDGFERIEEIKDSSNSEYVQLIKNDFRDTIASSKSILYIGETSNYIFFYNRENRTSKVYSKDKIDVINRK